jgi:hypothetical protein
MKQSLVLNIKNNTSGTVPTTILGPFNNDIINARTRYAWNITGIVFIPPFFSIEAKGDPSQSFTVYSGTATNASSLVSALNSLYVGVFWTETSGPNTYIVTWNDNLIYQNLVIGSASTFAIAMNIATGGQALAATINGTGTISGIIDFGDGNSTAFSQAGPVAFNHAYVVPGTYTAQVFLDNPGNITSISASNTRISGLSSLNNLPNLATISLINTIISSIDVTANPLLTSLSVINGVGVPGQLTSVDVTQNTLLTSLIVIFHAINFTDISQNTLLTVYDQQQCNLTQVDISNNPSLLTCRVNNNNLPTLQINNALIILDTNGLLNGSFTSFGQVPAAPPSGAGAVAKTNLQGKGWSVTTD